MGARHTNPTSTSRPPGAVTEGSPTPAESLRLIEAQRDEAARAFFGTPVPMLLLWGATWLLGFGAFFFATWNGRHLPAWAAALVMVVLGATAASSSFVQLARQSHGLRGPSPSVAARYGWSWAIGLLAVTAFDLGLDHQHLPASVQPILWPASFLVVAGLLYLAGGVVFGDKVTFALGAWTLVVAAASTFAGVPGNFAVLSLAGGGGLLAAGALLRPRFHRAAPAR